MSLDKQTNKFNIVINLPNKGKQFTSLDLQSACVSLFKEYSFIFHDKDVLQNGEMKTKHYHVVAKGNRQRLITIINKLAQYLGIDTTLVSCKKCVTYIGSLQYLIHKNDLEKYQYLESNIVTNMDREDLHSLLVSDNDDISLDRIINLVQNCRSLTELIKEVGLSTYVGYRNVIIDLWKDKYNYYEK